MEVAPQVSFPPMLESSLCEKSPDTSSTERRTLPFGPAMLNARKVREEDTPGDALTEAGTHVKSRIMRMENWREPEPETGWSGRRYLLPSDAALK